MYLIGKIMNFVWAGNREKKNTELIFSIQNNSNADMLTVCAVDFFRIYLDGEFVSFGPERTASGYSVKREISVLGAKKIEVAVNAYNVSCYSCDKQLPFFGAELKKGEKTVATTKDFACENNDARRTDVPRYSYQRGFVEVYDLTKGRTPLETYSVQAPVILNGIGDNADYSKVTPKFISEKQFNGFDKVSDAFFEKMPLYLTDEGSFEVKKDFVEKVSNGDYIAYDHDFGREMTGFIGLNIQANEGDEVFVCFEEILVDGKWNFRRTTCNDMLSFKLKGGEYCVTSEEPYAFRYIKIICKKGVKVEPYLITFENSKANCIKAEGDENIVAIFNAANNTFRQNAVDIYTDCPGRERAGWLCDSYFTARAEQFFCGNNAVEKRFLENYLLANCEELEKGALPDCFPAQHPDHCYIPNWMMFFLIETCEYVSRTGDTSFLTKAKDKVYATIEYFKQFENEFSLLEDLRAWIFVEWSICNSPEYIRGVNFPSNMLYAYALREIGKAYNDNALIKKSEIMQAHIIELSYNGKFFTDNAERENGKLIRRDDHISETCQYYALYFEITDNEEYIERIKADFGPFRKDAYSEIGRSNAFIGNYLRLFWLAKEREYARVLDESVEYFGKMANLTGTLWEKDMPEASCDHGFASSVAVLLAQCLVGYKGVENGEVVYDEKIANGERRYNVKLTFNYGKEITL